jgi:hypothetical protein
MCACAHAYERICIESKCIFIHAHECTLEMRYYNSKKANHIIFTKINVYRIYELIAGIVDISPF